MWATQGALAAHLFQSHLAGSLRLPAFAALVILDRNAEFRFALAHEQDIESTGSGDLTTRGWGW